MFEKDTSNIYYCPCCPSCGSILKLKFTKGNFTIDYECSKNKNHKGGKIFYEAFDRFYLKQKQLNNCIKCNIKGFTYKCKICENYYFCFTP